MLNCSETGTFTNKPPANPTLDFASSYPSFEIDATLIPPLIPNDGPVCAKANVQATRPNPKNNFFIISNFKFLFYGKDTSKFFAKNLKSKAIFRK